MRIEKTIEIVQRKGQNANQPFRRMISRQLGEEDKVYGMAIIDQDDLEYRKAQEVLIRRMKGDILLSGPIGFGYLLLSALNQPGVTSVSINMSPNHPEEERILAMASTHPKFKGLREDTEGLSSYSHNSVRELYLKQLQNSLKPKKKLGKFI